MKKILSGKTLESKLKALNNRDEREARKAAHEIHGKEVGEKLYKMAQDAKRRKSIVK